MEMLYTTFLMLMLQANVFTCAESSSSVFEMKQSFDGKSCNESDFLFQTVLQRSKFDCLIECENHADCVSVFHVQETGDCAGCKVRYDSTSSPIEEMDGSKYYEEQKCPTGWIVIEHSCYFITQEETSFENGIAMCKSVDAHGVIMNDEAEHNNMKTLINSMAFTNEVYGLYTAFTSTERDIWTVYGSTDPLVVDDWAQFEPSYDATENCLIYFRPMNLQWIDVPCLKELRMICEKEI